MPSISTNRTEYTFCAFVSAEAKPKLRAAEHRGRIVRKSSRAYVRRVTRRRAYVITVYAYRPCHPIMYLALSSLHKRWAWLHCMRMDDCIILASFFSRTICENACTSNMWRKSRVLLSERSVLFLPIYKCTPTLTFKLLHSESDSE